MKRKPALHISIPQPCKQRYEEMPAAGDGKFCNQCQHIIYDFSQMTDSELYRFFENNSIACGRFHNDQLNRNIVPVIIKRNIFQRTAKIAASIITILSLRNTNAQAQQSPAQTVSQNPAKTNNVLPVAGGTLVIKGTVKTHYENKPLQNVLVNFDGIKETRTDENGFYSIELTGIDRSHNIYFSCPNYVPTVRTFNPAMGSTNFNILMGERDSNAVVMSMGIPALPFRGNNNYIPADFSPFAFKGSTVLLNEDHKEMLRIIAAKLKANPTMSIILESAPLVHGNRKIPMKRMEVMKTYLVEKEGISEARINIEMGDKPENNNTVQVIGQ